MGDVVADVIHVRMKIKMKQHRVGNCNVSVWICLVSFRAAITQQTSGLLMKHNFNVSILLWLLSDYSFFLQAPMPNTKTKPAGDFL